MSWCLPQRRQVVGQGLDLGSLRRAQLHELRLLEPMVVLLQAPLPQQSLFPVSFQRPRRQAVLRLDGVVLPEYTVGVLSRPLQP